MTSSIDTTSPASNSSLSSAAIRANWTAAASDITTLQNKTTQTSYATTATVQFAKTVTQQMSSGAYTAPTITKGAALGAGTTIATVLGCDSFMYVSLKAGTSPTTNATLATITFNATFPTTSMGGMAVIVGQDGPSCALQSASATAITYTMTPTTLTLTSGSSAFTSGVTYNFAILIIA